MYQDNARRRIWWSLGIASSLIPELNPTTRRSCQTCHLINDWRVLSLATNLERPTLHREHPPCVGRLKQVSIPLPFLHTNLTSDPVHAGTPTIRRRSLPHGMRWAQMDKESEVRPPVNIQTIMCNHFRNFIIITDQLVRINR